MFGIGTLGGKLISGPSVEGSVSEYKAPDGPLVFAAADGEGGGLGLGVGRGLPGACALVSLHCRVLCAPAPGLGACGGGRAEDGRRLCTCHCLPALPPSPPAPSL